MLVFFIWISPFGWQSFHFQALPRFASKLFTQHLSFPQIDITQTMNVMDMVKKEDIPYREIDIDTRTPIVSVVDKPSIGKSIYIYSTHQGETYLDMNGVKEASHVFADMLRKKG